MEHQWFCGGKDPCACMDSWKEAELEKESAEIERRLDWNDYFRVMRESNIGETMPGGPGPSIMPPFAPLPCVHDWAFLRTDTILEGDPVKWGSSFAAQQNSKLEKYDVFFCRRCLEYRTKGD